jgi:YrbI family 3-deoxy-D-manno-octulosonate 8-phosphate phosphatase
MEDLQQFKMEDLQIKLAKIKWVLTDCDGVLTDGGVYYGEQGEYLKKFNIRDGMGVERLRTLVQVPTGIITGESSPSVVKRAEKLGITELNLGVKEKKGVVNRILKRYYLKTEELAYIGDDVNDLVVRSLVGLFFCPADALPQVKAEADVILTLDGGRGCFREMAEMIIKAKTD